MQSWCDCTGLDLTCSARVSDSAGTSDRRSPSSLFSQSQPVIMPKTVGDLRSRPVRGEKVALLRWWSRRSAQRPTPCEITKPFCLGATGVTQEQRKHIMGTKPSRLKNANRLVKM
jgi:hypothetical protein